MYIVGNDSVGVIDTGTVECSNEMLDEVERLFKKPLRYAILTHNHADHANGLPVFLDMPVTLYCSHKCVAGFAARGPRALITGVKGSLLLSLDGMDIELFTLEDVCHSPWDMFVRFKNDGLLASGDTVNDPGMLYFHHANPERWSAGLREIARGGDKLLLRGHGDIVPLAFAGEIADFLDLLMDVAAGIVRGEFPSGMLRDIAFEELDGHVRRYLASGTPQAREIREKAGERDAARVLRAALRQQLFRRC